MNGFSLNSHSWKSIWREKENRWVLHHDSNWCGLLASVLMYSNCNVPGTRFNAIASILGVEQEWLFGFCNSASGEYKSKVKEICKRKSKKGQQCRDGREIGKFFKLAYLSDNFLQWSFYTTTKQSFDTHQWEPLEEYKILISMGMNYNPSLKKCAQCNLYGSVGKTYIYNEVAYYLNDIWDTTKFRPKEMLDLTCNEITIKKLLS